MDELRLIGAPRLTAIVLVLGSLAAACGGGSKDSGATQEFAEAPSTHRASSTRGPLPTSGFR